MQGSSGEGEENRRRPGQRTDGGKRMTTRDNHTGPIGSCHRIPPTINFLPSAICHLPTSLSPTPPYRYAAPVGRVRQE